MVQMLEDVKVLCSQELEGRLSGTQGTRRAAAFLAKRLEEIGFQPAGKNGYFEAVNVPAARLTGEATLSIGKWNLLHRVEFGENAFFGGGSAEGELIVIDESTSYHDTELIGKIALLLNIDGLDLKSTVQGAKAAGIQAILMDGGEPRWFHKSVMGDYYTGEKNIPVIKIRSSLIPEFIRLKGEKVNLELPIITSTEECQNVMGLLPGNDPNGKTVALVSHYDFLGDDPNGYRFEGAGDNAAGVATMLEVAKLISHSKERLPFNVLLVFTTGEESNLWGEKHLIHNPPVLLDKSIYLDAIGRSSYYSLNFIYDEKDRVLVDVLLQECDEMGIQVNKKETQAHLFDVLITGTSRVKFRPYHSPDDTWKLLHIEVLEEVAQMIFRSLKKIEFHIL